MTHLRVEPNARLRWIFIGSQGLRAGWSLLIFFALLAPLDLIRGIVKYYYPSLFIADIAPGDALLTEAVQLAFIVGAMA
ncbi:MAG TPA: hypothetical protein VK801_02775, partial [Caulobacteraceae bacterium]|nr:hypothetical protein [Caulobacteraceae bacterium]